VCFFYCNLLLVQAKLIEAYIFWKKKKCFKLIYQSRLHVLWCLYRTKILYVRILFQFCVYIYIYKDDLQKLGCGSMDWIGLAQDRDRWRTLVSAVMNLQVPWNAWNYLTSCKPVSFSRRNLHRAVSKYIYLYCSRNVNIGSCPHTLLFNGYLSSGTFPGGIVATAWNWPLISM